MGNYYDRNTDIHGNYYRRVHRSEENSFYALKLIAKYDVDYVCFGYGVESVDYYICPTCKNVRWVVSDSFVESVCFGA